MQQGTSWLKTVMVARNSLSRSPAGREGEREGVGFSLLCHQFVTSCITMGKMAMVAQTKQGGARTLAGPSPDAWRTPPAAPSTPTASSVSPVGLTLSQ